MNALPDEPVSRHPLGPEIRLYMMFRVVAATLVALMLSLPQTTYFFGLGVTSPAGIAGIAYVVAASGLLAYGYTQAQVRVHMIAAVLVDVAFTAIVLWLLPSGILIMGVLLLFTIASASMLVSVSFGALAATFACAVLVWLHTQSLEAQDSTGPFLIPMMLAYYTIALLAGRIGNRIALATWATSAQREEITELSALNDQILKRLPVGVLVVDAEGDIQSSNEMGARLLQLPPEGERRSLALASNDVNRMLLAWQSAPDGERSPVTLGADQRLIEPQFFKLYPGSDDVLIFLEDTSQATKRAETITLATLGRFSASLAHEIRNPLSAIKYSSQLLRESKNLDVMDRRMLDIIQQQIQRMDDIIDSVLGLARRQRAEPETFDVHRMLRDFRTEYSAGFPLDNDTLELQAQPNPQYAHADPKQIHQILMVLVSNARYYGRMPDSPATMTLRLQTTPTAHVVDMLDEGPGIHETAQKSLFRPFFTTSGHGTGLGLYIARELARANHGDLQYLPRARGSCFRLTIPTTPTESAE